MESKKIRVAKELVKLAKSLMITADGNEGDENNGAQIDESQMDESQIKSEVSALLSQAESFQDAGEQMAEEAGNIEEQFQEIQQEVTRSLRIASRKGVNASDVANSIREFKIASVEFLNSYKDYSAALSKHRLVCRRIRQAGFFDKVKGWWKKYKEDVKEELQNDKEGQQMIKDYQEAGRNLGAMLARLVEKAKKFMATLAKVVAMIALGPVFLVIGAVVAIQKTVHAIGTGIAKLLKKGKEEFIKLWDALNKWIDDVVSRCQEAVKKAKEATKEAAKDIMKALYDELVSMGKDVAKIIEAILGFFKSIKEGYDAEAAK